MSTSAETRERETLRMLKAAYEQRGYSFVLEPSAAVLPPFLEDYRPDAIALKAPGGVVIEVVSSSGRSQPRVQELKRLFAGQKDWTLDVVTAKREDLSNIPASSTDQIATELDAIPDVAATHARGALLLAWAVLEAAARVASRSANEASERAIVPAQIPDILTREGFIDQSTAIWLRTMAKVRNSVAHGDVSRHVSRDEIDRITSIIRNVLNEVRRERISAQTQSSNSSS